MKKNLFVCVILSLFALSSCDKAVETDKTEAQKVEVQNVEPQKIEVPKAEEQAKAELVQKLPKLVDLGATKCNVCKAMAPILEGLTEEYRGIFEVEFIDVWQAENKLKADAYGIKSIPTQLFFDADGKELWRHEGALNKDEILNKWKELGFDFETALKINAPQGSAAAESE